MAIGLDTRALRHRRDLVLTLVEREYRSRYQRSILGVFWGLLTPLLTFLVFSVVFSQFPRVPVANYPAYLFAGLLPWTWFAASLQSSANTLYDNPDLVRQPSFPAAWLPVIAVGAELVTFVLGLPILAVVSWPPQLFHPSAFGLLVVAVVVQYAFCVGLGLTLGVARVFFHDVQHIISVILLLLFYATPIFYPPEMVPAEYRWIAGLNPMASLVTVFRSALLGTPAAMTTLLCPAAVAAALCVAGLTLFRATRDSLVEEL